MTHPIKKEFIIERQGRQFVLYAGLLDLAHAQSLRAIRTRLIQVPSDENGLTAIVSAEVETERGLFSGIGDASPANVSRAMLTCTIRLAETRAKARALRDAVNASGLGLEGDDDDDLPELPPERAAAQPARAAVQDDGMEARLHPPQGAERLRGSPTTAMTRPLAEAWEVYRASLKRVREAGYKFSAIGEHSPLETVLASTKVLDDKFAAHQRNLDAPGTKARSA